jgi:site-specific recombinase XerD
VREGDAGVLAGVVAAALTARAAAPDQASEFEATATKKITAHVLRHSAAMRRLHAGVDTSVIALWLGRESVGTTQVYIHADMVMKETGDQPRHAT